ncbi:hypothetical protein FOZ63_020122 [Perkinsus olseni]|uniref:Uncharacterized protein n=1 Tax=Perkinsus olseni TaxID=32597 RepID=A0A7J6SM19_PEROL|nr:hypothetical protein FOZ63_020122 [Perkinsus olseni]
MMSGHPPSSIAVLGDSLVLHTILRNLRVSDILSLGISSTLMKASIMDSTALRRSICSDRGWNPDAVASWGEMARRENCLLYEDFHGDLYSHWKRGPNSKCPELNDVTVLGGQYSGDTRRWLRLSGGTDWQGFKGVYRTFGQEGGGPVNHYWLEFDLRVTDPEATSACVVLSEGIRNWGPRGVIMQLVYDGHRTGGAFVLRRPLGMQTIRGGFRRREVRVCDAHPQTTYRFLFFLDFVNQYVAFYVDGVLSGATQFASDAASPGAITLYAWRSQAELLISNTILTKSESILRVRPRGQKDAEVAIENARTNHPRLIFNFTIFVLAPVLAAIAVFWLWSFLRNLL